MMLHLLPLEIFKLATLVVSKNKAANRKIASAESCTGGLVSAALTEIEGSSHIFDRAFITYSNEAKSQMIGVSDDIIACHGAVSLPVVRAMALGAIKNSNADIAISISGVAGPGGGSDEKPVGTVAFALADKNGLIKETIEYFNPQNSRAQIRYEATIFALNWLHIH